MTYSQALAFRTPLFPHMVPPSIWYGSLSGSISLSHLSIFYNISCYNSLVLLTFVSRSSCGFPIWERCNTICCKIWINGSNIYFQTKIHTIIAGGTKWGKRGFRNSSACGLTSPFFAAWYSGYHPYYRQKQSNYWQSFHPNWNSTYWKTNIHLLQRIPRIIRNYIRC